MNEAWITIFCVGLVTLGVVAELNLLRVLLGDWLQGRREARERLARLGSRTQTTTPAPGRESGRRMRRALAVAFVVLTPAFARAADNQQTQGLLFGPDATEQSPLRALALSFEPSEQPAEQPAAENKPLTISTNRPTFDDTTGIVPIGHVQLETGYTFTFRNRDGVETQTHNAPEILLRIPLIDDRLEVQLGTSGYVWSRSNSGSGFDSVEGFSDMTVGLRLKAVNQDGWVPRIALQASTTVGLGSRDISNRDVEPTLKIIWSYDLPEGWGIYGNIGVAYLTSGGERFVQGQFGLCLTYTLNDQWSFFGEYYLFGPNSKGTDAAHNFDVGAAYLVTPRIQLDFRIGVGLNREANNAFAGTGISFLF